MNPYTYPPLRSLLLERAKFYSEEWLDEQAAACEEERWPVGTTFSKEDMCLSVVMFEAMLNCDDAVWDAFKRATDGRGGADNDPDSEYEGDWDDDGPDSQTDPCFYVDAKGAIAPQAIRPRHREHEPWVPLAMMRDKSLTNGARGFLALVLASPDSWKRSIKECALEQGADVLTVQGWIRELAKAGYVRPRDTHEETQYRVEWLVYDRPCHDHEANLHQPWTHRDERIPKLVKMVLNLRRPLNEAYPDRNFPKLIADWLRSERLLPPTMEVLSESDQD